MNPTPEQMDLARKIANEVVPSGYMNHLRCAYDGALAAIIQTSELAANHIRALRIGYERNGVDVDPLVVAASDIRNGDFLK